MDELFNVFEFTLRGLFIGAIYALMASGLSLIFGVMRVINVAHGEFLMLASLMLTLGVSIVLWNVAHALFSPDPKAISYLFDPIQIFGMYFAKNSLFFMPMPNSLIWPSTPVSLECCCSGPEAFSGRV